MTDLPTTATAFIAFMNRVWDIHQEPAPDGGVVLFASADYDEWHDAVSAAKRCGMRRTGSSSPDGNDPRWWSV